MKMLLVVKLLLLVTLSNAQVTSNFVEVLMELMGRGQSDIQLEVSDERVPLLSSYDFIVVGAGTAGCAIAARLSENPEWKVLLIEAGGPESYIMDLPIVVHFLQLGEMNWKYRTEASSSYCLAMNNNRCNWPRGKVMGGSSVLNYMMYTRGNRKDYDRWAALGNEGWSFKDVLPYFKKYEGSSVPDAEEEFVGRDGPVKINYIKYRTSIADAFVNAAREGGLKYRDYNGREQVGVSYLQTNTQNATRWSSNRAYLYPLKGKRPNLHIKKNAMVTKVLIDPSSKTAYGVMLTANGRTQKLLARKEVILTAGAINTPQLLMLSGIGPAQHLREVGIKPIADLAVGYNLQDHIAPAVTFTTNASSLHVSQIVSTENIRKFIRGDGVFGLPGGCETIAFYALGGPDNQTQTPAIDDDYDESWPDVELFMVSGSLHTNPALQRALGLRSDIYKALFDDLERKDRDAFIIFPMILRPKSRGRIMLRSSDPFKYPIIHANYFAHPYDMKIAIRGIKQIISLMYQPSFKAINAKLLKKTLPACRRFGIETDAYWNCYARHFTLTIYHYAGTAKMGPATDPAAVVDARLRVHGINNLRVADASIMPELMSGHPNGPVFMIAEKAADMIKQDHNYI